MRPQKMTEKLRDEDVIGIPEFYKGKSVLLTGFTGCIGKLLAEKIIYSCPDVNKIYVLVRNRKGQSAQDRVQETLQSVAFNRIRDKYGDILNSKVVAISSNLLEEKLGLSKEDEELLKREVNVILHGAASVRFDDPLGLAIKLNTLGTKMMADFALTMAHLKSFIYISTAYTNCDHLHIEERIYPPKADWREMLEIAEKLDPAMLHTLHGKVIGGLPNTYVFSKSLAEHVVNDYRDKLSIAIVRPSIVVPACNEPMPGWIDNKYGPISLMVGFFLGIVRCSWVDVRQKCNYIFSDVVVNAILIVSWRIAKSSKSLEKTDSVNVYNVCSPPKFNVNHKEFSLIYTKGKSIDVLKEDKMDYISMLFIRNKQIYWINVIVRHVIPALVIDLILKLMKIKFQLLSIRIKVFIAAEALSYFTMRTFTFEDNNFTSLIHDLNENDKESFGWNLNCSVYDMYDEAYYVIRKHTLLKKLYDDIDKFRMRIRMLYIIDKASVYLIYGTLIWLLYNFSIPQNIFFSFISFFTLSNKY